MSFALMLGSELPSEPRVLLLLDERPAAEEIANELRRKGHPVEVREAPAADKQGPIGRRAKFFEPR